MNRKTEKLNVFMKSVLRQKVRTFIFFLIIAAAAFAFVLRSTEFVIVRDRIDSIAENFRSIGFLNLRDAPYGNILEGADIVGASRYVGFEDRRRGAEAVLHGMHNTNTGGRVGDGGHILTGLEVSHIPVPQRDVFSYFYFTLDRMTVFNHPATGHFVELRAIVDEVEAGYLEHAYGGDPRTRETRVRWYMDLDATENPLENMVEGERYFIRAAFYWVSTHGRGMTATPPSFYGAAHILYMHPLTEDGLMYLHAPGGPIDFTAPGMEEIAAGIGQSNYNASVLWLRTTADMTAMPLTREGMGSIDLVSGRFIDHEDYLLGRPVAVIHQRLAQMRGLSVGDTITVSVPGNQRIVNLNTAMLFGAMDLTAMAHRHENFVFRDGFLDFAILGDPDEFIVEKLELEIVGTYRKLQSETWAGDWSMSYIPALLSNYVYIPDSLLPEGFMPADELRGYDLYLWDLWYSFELADTRNESAFLQEVRVQLEELGIIAHLMPSGAANFWLSAEPVMLSATVNAAIFVVVLVLLLSLVSFLYLGQRRKDFAIARALGLPAKTAVRQMCSPAALFAVPAIVLGGTAGWILALNEAANTIGAFAEFELYTNAYYGGYAAIEISQGWLALQLGLMTCIMLVMVGAGAARTAKLPVLELLQGRSVKVPAAKENLRSSEDRSFVPGQQAGEGISAASGRMPGAGNPHGQQSAAQLSSSQPQSQHGAALAQGTSAKRRLAASAQFIIRHIMRSPLKTALTAGTAVLFIVALGLLQQTMVSTQREVDRLYDTTIVSGELMASNPFLHAGGGANLTVLNYTYENLSRSGLFKNYYIEAQFSDFFLIHPGEDGNFPVGEQGEFWDEFWHYIRHELLGVAELRTDPIFAFNDFDIFLERNGEQPGDLMPDIAGAGLFDFEEMGLGVVTDPLDIQFGAGFSREDFVYNDPSLKSPIPVIVSDLTLVRRELNVGDMAFLGHYFPAVWTGAEQVEVPVQVIGWHNGNIAHPQGRNAVLIPMEAFQSIRGDRMSYITFEFEVDPAHNRDLQLVRDEVQAIIRGGRQSTFMGLDSVLRDEELRIVAGQMEQNLALMVLLYPVVIAVSVVIGAALALLLLMQSARIAAILRVLGYGRRRTRTMLSTEHAVVVACGVIVAFIAMPAAGISFTGQLPFLAALYVLGAVLGAVAG
ncbi:MAG: hypothetical protein FWB75_04465, partial [Oscillospiraceae bacterium]|nr:hypothetical protein [Oscillospiraceae bacterium]